MMMMMIAPNSLFRQKEGAQKEEAEDRRKRGQIGTPTQGSDASTDPLGHCRRMQGTGENMNGGVRFYSKGGVEGARD